MADMLAGGSVKLTGQADWLEAATLPFADEANLHIVATEQPHDGHSGKLVFHPQTHVVGLGCSRGCSLEELDDLLQQSLEQANISIGAVAAFASIDLKADEVAMNKLATRHNKPFRLFTADELNEHKERLQTPSDVVFAEVGCYGVSEGSALAGVGAAGELVLPKQKTANATVAIAKASAPVNYGNIGRARGRLHVIGIGPGQDAWRTPEASSWLAEADEVVGYGSTWTLFPRSSEASNATPSRWVQKKNASALRSKGRAGPQRSARLFRRLWRLRHGCSGF